MKARLLGRLGPYVRRHLGLAVAAVAFLLVTDAAGVVQPYLVKVAVDTNIMSGDLAGLGRTALLIGAVMLASFLFEVAFNYAIQYLGQRLVLDLRLELFAKVLSLSRSYFDRTPVGDTLTNLSNDVEAIREFVSSGIVTVVGELLRVLLILVAMLLINARLALMAFVTIPFFVLATAAFRASIRGGFRDVRAANSAINVTLVETISGIREIHQLGIEERSRRGFDRSNRTYLTAYLRVVRAYALFFPVMEVVTNASMVLVLLFAHFAAGLTVRVGEVFAFFSYVNMFFWPLRQLAEQFNTLQSALAATERVFRLQDEVVSVPPPARPRLLGAGARGAVSFRDVSFSYLPGTPVIRNVSFDVSAGEKVAIVGATGSGKSTLMALATRLYDVSAGSVRLDGADVRELDFRELRTVVATVPQDAFIFTGTVAQNISLWDPGISRERIVEAGRLVCADRFVAHLSQGYDTEVLEEGKRLSAGQRQLLGLARAVVRYPRVVILDEATASIDAETEKAIQDGIEGLLQGRTALIIAHRLSTIRSVDRILVMHRGEIVEQGTHAALMARGGVYSRLYEMQTLLLRTEG